MISLEQIRQLDISVKKAVTALKKLSSENTALKQQVTELEARLDELRREASDRIADEEQLEVSLQGVLDVLDEVNSETSELESEPPAENDILETVPEPEESPSEENDAEQDILFAAEEEVVEADDADETGDTEEPAAAELQEESIESVEAEGSNDDKSQSEFDIF